MPERAIEPPFNTVDVLDAHRTCPNCGNHGLDITGWEQDALIRHGGYGATERTVLRSCPACGWRLIIEHGEVRPPKEHRP